MCCTRILSHACCNRGVDFLFGPFFFFFFFTQLVVPMLSGVDAQIIVVEQPVKTLKSYQAESVRGRLHPPSGSCCCPACQKFPVHTIFLTLGSVGHSNTQDFVFVSPHLFLLFFFLKKRSSSKLILSGCSGGGPSHGGLLRPCVPVVLPMS